MSTEVSEQSAVITPHQHGWFFSTPEEKIKKNIKNIKLQIGSLVQILNVANYKKGSPAHVRFWELKKDLVTEYYELNKEIGKSYNDIINTNPDELQKWLSSLGLTEQAKALLNTDGSFFIPWELQEEYGYGIGKDSANILFQLIRKIRLDKSDGLHNAASKDDIREDMKWQNAQRQQGIHAVDARQKGAREQENKEVVTRTRKFETNKQNRLKLKNERRQALGLGSNPD
jgi:hypothetical protein